ncbi:DNA-processing protein DprA [Microbacterium binotii]|uniref:DNA-processing protein DprA n=1 Tax=Microbacterium binotii TaxID=462710 RepID=UPI001F1C0539|nr:DNA-processing protein DprA [Microbacterium binotii]UIN32049.1 DNA-processing protein DprA [Microbacterium binotii]
MNVHAVVESMLPMLGERATPELAARVFWSGVAEPGDALAGALLARVPAETALRVASHAAEIQRITGAGARAAADAAARWRPRLRDDLLTDPLERAERSRVTILVPTDPEWPEALDDLGDHAPIALWVRGAPDALRAPSIALVGARAATAYGEHVAAELAAGVVAAGVSVVSGAAYGIDGAAHRSALATRSGSTVAVLAGGCDRSYPAGHERMLERIAATAAVVAEVPCGAAPTKWRFLARNRLIAALSLATIVVEAGARSGSLNTAGHAASLGRPLGAVPGPVTSAASIGCHRLLREFDAVCVTDAAEARELAGLGMARPLVVPGARTDERTRIRDALSPRVGRDAAELAARSGLATAEVEAILGVMLLEGSVVGVDGGWRRRAGR